MTAFEANEGLLVEVFAARVLVGGVSLQVFFQLGHAQLTSIPADSNQTSRNNKQNNNSMANNKQNNSMGFVR